jgi:ABC-type proline/glycine betaine transport system ATPase subunit
MKTKFVSIDFTKMAVAFRKHVLEKALNAGSTIVYMKDGKLIEEDPKIFLTLKNNIAVQ